MDVDYPVWTIRPNWATGVLERLEWLTDVIVSDTGVEQRRSSRPTPRRSFEITVNPTRRDRTYLDLQLHRLGSATWLFPLWHDQARLSARALAGNSALAFDNTFREFVTGGYAIVYFDTFGWEVVQIQAQDANGLTLVAPLEHDWNARTKVYPLRKALVATDTTLKNLTSRVGESTLLFQINEANEYPEMSGDAMVSYAGSPLLVQAPNRVTEITIDHVRLFDQADGQVGLVSRVDTAGRAFAIQSHNWQVTGREAQAGFRSFLYTLRGRQRMVWLPSFNDDLTLTRPADKTATVTIEKIGMRYVGGNSPIPGRATLWTGSEVCRIATLPAPPSAFEERLALLAPTTGTYAVGASWSFLEPARFNQDAIEIHHNADSEGTFECAATFHTFANDRDASGVIYNPIPAAARSTDPCGAPIGLNPCAATLPDWKYKLTMGKRGDTFISDKNMNIRIGADGGGGTIAIWNVNESTSQVHSSGVVEAQTIYLYDTPGLIWGPGQWRWIMYGDFSGNILDVTIGIQKFDEPVAHVVVNDHRENAGYTNYIYSWDQIR